jgi:hypothetical protein
MPGPWTFDEAVEAIESLGVRCDEPRDDAPKRERATSPKLLLRRAFTEARDRLSAF